MTTIIKKIGKIAAIAMMIAFSLTLVGTVTNAAQPATYDTIYMGAQPSGSHTANCTLTDSTIYVAPGANVDYWIAGGETITYRGDSTLIAMPSSYGVGVNGQRIDCYYNGGIDYWIRVHAVNSLTSAGFPVTDTVCGTGTLTLDLLNASTYQTTFNWWKDGVLQTTHTQTFTTGEGVIVGEATNACGTITNTVTVIEYNPNPPTLHDDTICMGQNAGLNPGNFDTYNWNTGSQDSIIYPTVSGTYSVTVTDNGCTSTASAERTVSTPPIIDIILVTNQINPLLPGVGNLMVLWNGTNLANAVSTVIEIQQPGDTAYIPTDTVAYPLGQVTTNVAANEQAQWFKVRCIDSCGNLGNESGYYKSIIASSYTNMNNKVTITWEPPEIGGKALLDVIQSFDICRWNHQTLQYDIIGTALPGNTMFIDQSPNQFDSIYVVGANIITAKSLVKSYSNLTNPLDSASGIQEGVEIEFDIYPNPANRIIHIQSKDKKLFIAIFDLEGKLVLHSYEKEINVSSIPAGTYVLNVVNDAGLVGEKKIIIY